MDYTKKQNKALKDLDDYLEGASEEQLKADRESILYPEEWDRLKGEILWEDYLRSFSPCPPEAERKD